MIKSIVLGGREISYEHERKNVKNVNLRIRSDCSVYVSSSAQIDDCVIESFLQKKADYILSALNKYAEIAKYATGKHEYITGESLRYLGKYLRLVVEQGKNGVSSDGVCITLSVTDVDDIILRERLIEKWYDTQCQVIFNEIVSEIFPIFKKYAVTMPRITLRNMSSRWGSCQPKRGIITLNKKLIQTPRVAIEYVVMHEFVHFLHPNHSATFYEMLSVFMPDWKARKKHLEATVFKLIE